MSVYKIHIDTANLVEASPYVRPEDNRLLFLGPGTKAAVRMTLYGAQGVSQPITVSGATGKVLYGETDMGGVPLVHGYADRQPFAAGKRATILLQPEPPLAIGALEKIIIGCNRQGPGPEWFLLRITVEGESGQSFVFPCRQWLVGEELDLRSAGPVGVFDTAHFDAVVFGNESPPTPPLTSQPGAKRKVRQGRGRHDR
jgi:hypothetical protein